MLITANLSPQFLEWLVILVLIIILANEAETKHDGGHLVVLDRLREPFLLGIIIADKIHLIANQIEILVKTIMHNLIRSRVNWHSLSGLLLDQLLLIDFFLRLDSVSFVDDLFEASVHGHLPCRSADLRVEYEILFLFGFDLSFSMNEFVVSLRCLKTIILLGRIDISTPSLLKILNRFLVDCGRFLMGS